MEQVRVVFIFHENSPTDSNLVSDDNWFKFNFKWFRSTFNAWNARSWMSSSSMGGGKTKTFVSTKLLSRGWIGELTGTRPNQKMSRQRRILFLNLPLLIISRSWGRKLSSKASFDHKPWEICMKRSVLENEWRQRDEDNTGKSIWRRRLLPASQSQKIFIADKRYSFSNSSIINFVPWYRVVL